MNIYISSFPLGHTQHYQSMSIVCVNVLMIMCFLDFCSCHQRFVIYYYHRSFNDCMIFSIREGDAKNINNIDIWIILLYVVFCVLLQYPYLLCMRFFFTFVFLFLLKVSQRIFLCKWKCLFTKKITLVFTASEVFVFPFLLNVTEKKCLKKENWWTC